MSTEKIRKILMDELDSLINGKSDTARADSVARLSAQAIYTTRLELENKRIEVDISKTLSDKPRWNMIDGNEVTIPAIKFKK